MSAISPGDNLGPLLRCAAREIGYESEEVLAPCANTLEPAGRSSRVSQSHVPAVRTQHTPAMVSRRRIASEGEVEASSNRRQRKTQVMVNSRPYRPRLWPYVDIPTLCKHPLIRPSDLGARVGQKVRNRGLLWRGHDDGIEARSYSSQSRATSTQQVRWQILPSGTRIS